MTARIMPIQLVDLAEVVDACDRLAGAILESGFRPDLVVAIARGGFVPARFLCDFLQVGKLAGFRVQHYQAGAKKESQARVTIPLSIAIAGANVLLVDDVNDSGKTLEAAIPHLQSFSPGEVRTAVIHEKITTARAADYKAFTLREWHWVLYPWAVVEDVGQFVCSMEPAPQSVTEIRERLADDYELTLNAQQLDRVLRFGKTRLDFPWL